MRRVMRSAPTATRRLKPLRLFSIPLNYTKCPHRYALYLTRIQRPERID